MFKKVLAPLFILSIALFMITGCGDDSATEPTPVNEFDLVAAVGDVYFTEYTTASGGVNALIGDVFDVLSTDANAYYIIDYRSDTDFDAGHIIGANNMTLAGLAENFDNLPTDKPILNVCYSGQTASVATAVLNMLGFDALNLKWGMCGVDTSISGSQKWLTRIEADEQADLETDVNTTTTTYSFPDPDTDKSSAEDIIKDRFATKVAPGWPNIEADLVWDNADDYFIINYWPEAHYLNPGHIPGSYQFTPNISLEKDEMLNLLPTDKTIVVYCYTGQTSAQVATYLTILGYEAKSLLYGTNGFAYNAPGYEAARYTAPEPGIYDSILE